jgi:glyoxylase-like metal-dependent hydrolase (beta-lactamase superfamily II)
MRRAALATLVFSSLLAACQEPLPIPRIEPELENWSQPYEGVEGIRVHAFRTGGMRSIEGATWAGGSWTTSVELGMWAFVVQHPRSGLVVFDTGLAARCRTEPEHYVGWLGAKLHMIRVPEHATLAEQMRASGLDPADVTRVVISHVHFDHTGGIPDFPNATVVVSSAEKDWVVHGLKRTDFVDLDALRGMEKWQTIDFSKEKRLATLVAANDLLGDGSVLAVDLSGHTPGSTGLLIRTAAAPILLTGDAAWVKKSWVYPARPIVAYDMNLWWEQAWRIKRFAMLEPKLVVVPGHDDVAVADVETPAFLVHDLPGSASAEHVAASN